MSPVKLAVGALFTAPLFAQVALVCVIAAAAVSLAIFFIYRRRRRRAGITELRHRSVPPPVPSLSVAVTRRSGSSGVRTRGTVGSSGALAVASSTPAKVACPACRREFPSGVRFCSFDSRRLVPLSELVERSRVGGSVCPRCRRSFDAGVRYCPHDAEELMSVSLWEATRGRKHDAAMTGVLAKICPQCANRYDLATSFCGKDGAELMTIN